MKHLLLTTIAAAMLGLFICALLLNPDSAFAQEQKNTVTTFTYKKVGDLEIKLDAHRPADKKIRPLAVWIHGGALIIRVPVQHAHCTSCLFTLQLWMQELDVVGCDVELVIVVGAVEPDDVDSG